MAEENDGNSEAGLPPALGVSNEDTDLLQALETLKRIIARPKRAPLGTNDVWGWSTDQEHAVEPGTEPREQVVERIRKTLKSDDGASSNRTALELSVLETIAHVIDTMKDKPEFAHHDLKRIVKALEAVVADKVGPGDAPPEPSKMMIAPGARTRKEIAEGLTKPVLTPEEETLDYAYIVSDHPVIAELVREHGLTTVWNELTRLRHDMPSVNPEIAETLSKVALAMEGISSPGIEASPHPKMYVDEKGEPVMYDKARGTDVFNIHLYWDTVGIHEKSDLVIDLKKRMDRTGSRPVSYASVRGYGEQMSALADTHGDQAVWIELMRLRHDVWPKNVELSEAIENIAEQHVPGLLDIPAGEEAPSPRLVADVKYDLNLLYRRGLELIEANKQALLLQERLESGKLGQYVKVPPWNTYFPVADKHSAKLIADFADKAEASLGGSDDQSASTEAETASAEDQAHAALKSLGLSGENIPTASILADALRIAASQIEQQQGIAQAGLASDGSVEGEVGSGKGKPEPVDKVFEQDGVRINYTEGYLALLAPIWGQEESYFREMVTAAEQEAYRMDRWRAKNASLAGPEGFRIVHEYKDNKRKDTWRGLGNLTQTVFWKDLPQEGLDKDNPYYPFTKDYVDFIMKMRELTLDKFHSFKEAEQITEKSGLFGMDRLRQVWKDSSKGEKRIWTGRQMYVWTEHVDQVLLKASPFKGVARWDLYDQIRDYDPPFDPPKLSEPRW